MNQTGFRLNPLLDPQKLAAGFRRSRRIHIPDFLVQEDAERLHRHLKDNPKWRLIFNQGEKLFELDREAQSAMTAEQRQQIELAVHQAARYSFQYLFESIRVPDGAAARSADATMLNDFARFLSSPAVIEMLREIVSAPDIGFADAQGTAYGLGHFLTAHDDEVAGKNRRAAYVFNLTPAWRIDWGGLLQFQGADGHVEEAFTPSFNALNIFAVPQPHNVSMVTPFAANRRYSVTGWLRAGDPPP